jgi:hypothetical protein
MRLSGGAPGFRLPRGSRTGVDAAATPPEDRAFRVCEPLRGKKYRVSGWSLWVSNAITVWRLGTLT